MQQDGRLLACLHAWFSLVFDLLDFPVLFQQQICSFLPFGISDLRPGQHGLGSMRCVISLGDPRMQRSSRLTTLSICTRRHVMSSTGCLTVLGPCRAPPMQCGWLSTRLLTDYAMPVPIPRRLHMHLESFPGKKQAGNMASPFHMPRDIAQDVTKRAW